MIKRNKIFSRLDRRDVTAWMTALPILKPDLWWWPIWWLKNETL